MVAGRQVFLELSESVTDQGCQETEGRILRPSAAVYLGIWGISNAIQLWVIGSLLLSAVLKYLALKTIQGSQCWPGRLHVAHRSL